MNHLKDNFPQIQNISTILKQQPYFKSYEKRMTSKKTWVTNKKIYKIYINLFFNKSLSLFFFIIYFVFSPCGLFLNFKIVCSL